MTNPITTPPELVQQWAREIYDKTSCGYERDEYIATRAAQWGADQELEACCALIEQKGFLPSSLLRAARRPKPPSLKQQALDRCNDYIDPDGIIRRALEALPE